MKNKGFTLVELLAVIVILGLLMVIAIPAVLTVANNVKTKSYETKIEMIENAAISYGEIIKRDYLVNQKKPDDTSTITCENGRTVWVTVSKENGVTCDRDGLIPAYRMSVEDLVTKANQLDWDEKDRGSNNPNYNNVIKNPVTDNIINKCVVYIYYKNNRVYSIYDKKSCDNATSGNEIVSGREYPDNI